MESILCVGVFAGVLDHQGENLLVKFYDCLTDWTSPGSGRFSNPIKVHVHESKLWDVQRLQNSNRYFHVRWVVKYGYVLLGMYGPEDAQKVAAIISGGVNLSVDWRPSEMVPEDYYAL